MRYYLGLVALLIGAWLIYSAINHRNRVLAARAQAAANGPVAEPDPQLTSMGIAMMPFYLFYGAFASLLLLGGFFLTKLHAYLSVLDLLGLLVLIVGYTAHITVRTYYTRIGLNILKAKA